MSLEEGIPRLLKKLVPRDSQEAGAVRFDYARRHPGGLIGRSSTAPLPAAGIFSI